MTLLKKLLPVASIAAAAAVVAPIVTSCAAGGSISFDPTVEPDVTGWKKSIKEEQTFEQATTEYVAAIHDDINTFKNDYRFGMSFASKYIEIDEKQSSKDENAEFIWDLAKCTLSNVSLSENGAMDAISFKSNVQLEITFIEKGIDYEKRSDMDIMTKTIVSMNTDALAVPYLITPNKSFVITAIPTFSLYFGDYFADGKYFKGLDKDWHVNASLSMKQEVYDLSTEHLLKAENAGSQWEVNKDNIIDINLGKAFGVNQIGSFIEFLYSWPSYFFLGTKVNESPVPVLEEI